VNALSKAKTNQQTEVTEMLSGLKSALPTTVKGIPVQGTTLTPVQVQGQLQAFLPLITAVATAKAAYAKALANRKAQDASITTLMVALRAYLKQLFAGNATTLAQFGIDVKPKSTKSTLEKATTVAKGNATRASNKTPPAQPQSQIVLYGADGAPINVPSSATAAPSASAAASPSGAGK